MSKELATTSGSALAVSAEQDRFTERQVAALRHMGVEHASEADLEVFLHIVKRTGLDPFARQIHMIERMANEQDESGAWRKVPKATIQTGIDGYRLIGRRAADRAGHAVAVSAPEWAHEDGSWRPVWSKAWGRPIAARVTVTRQGEPFTAVAIFDEYAQTKRNGDLNSMWAQRPGGQIAKCAEALAWRMAFPQDLAGLYTDDEMHQADTAPHDAPTATASEVLAPAVESEAPREVEGPEPPPEPRRAAPRTLDAIKANMTRVGLDRAAVLDMASQVEGREITDPRDMASDTAEAVLMGLSAPPDADSGAARAKAAVREAREEVAS